ncbi:MAG: serine/threonine-protein kinase [Gemmataceae bacterium]
MTTPSAEPTVTAAVPPAATAATAAWVAGPTADPGFDEELRRLLRSRLLLVQVLTIAYAALLLAMTALTPDDSQAHRDRIGDTLWVMLVLAGVGAAVVGRAPRMSLRALRGWELFHFGTQAAYCGLFRYVTLVRATTEMPSVEVGFRGAITLFGITTLILAYGVLIPNTPRRSLVVVLGLAAVPFLALAAAVAANPVLRWEHAPPLALQAAANLLIPAAIAVFAAARADALQRRAFEAERRAERVGQYALKRKLGEGGMGEVWLAEHALLKRPCAVKFVRPEAAAHPAAAARFEREVRAVTGLSHVNTVRVYDYGRADDGSFYLVMEYLDGPTLEALVRDAGPLPPGRAVYLLRQLCGALAEAHAAGLVHRDLKPGNVIVAALGGERDVAKLLDFGLVQDLAADPDARLTRAGTVMGTPAYMSPEQAAGEADVDARSDVYSLGAVAFFALAGRPPFQAKGLGQLLAAHRSQPAPPLADVRAGVPADLAAVVARCLAKAPAERFPSAAALGQALTSCACAGWSPDRAG